MPASSIPSINTATSSTAATNNALFYYNGKNTSAPGVATATTTPGTLYLGAAGAAPAEPMGGSIAEVIAYTSLVSAAERNKIESYLAIKYGISLDQTVATSYTNSAGTVIWNPLYNGIYKNNIFGVGIDNGSGLNQLQSVSANTSIIRMNNATGVVNGSYLFISDNGLSAGPQVQAGLPGGAVAASPLIWSVSKTGTVSTVDVTIAAPSANVVLLLDNDNNGVFETALTPTSVSGNSFTYAGLSLNNFAKLKLGYLSVSAPGGVSSNLKLWLKASSVGISGVSNVGTWIDQSGNGLDFTQAVSTSQPLMVNNSINNNPAINFSSKIMNNANGITGTGSISDINVYAVARINNSGGNTNLIQQSLSGGELAVYLPSSGTVYWRPKTPDVTMAFSSIPNNTLPRIYGFNASTTTGQTFSAIKNAIVSNGKVLASGATMSAFTGSVSNMSLGNAMQNDDIAEVIAYTGSVSAAQNKQIQSYLALKYGISIDQTTATNYTNSTGGTVWDATVNAAYTNNIFGIGRDNASGLNQTQSISVNTSRISIANPSGLVNGDYFILSDNNLSTTPTAQGSLPGGATLATPLVWSVSKIGTVGTVDLTIASSIQSALLLIDNDNNGTYETAVPATSVVTNSASYSNTYNGVSLNNLAKFKLGYVALPTQSSNVTITPLSTPSITACSGQGTFVVRVSNISGAPINNLIFRDSLPSNINYVAGSVSGTGVTFGSTIVANNVVTFNVAAIPSSGFVDITFSIAANCAVSTTAANIKNTYTAVWGSSFSNPYVTATYPILFPSVSITVGNANATAFCLTPFVKTITICNGGFGSMDSVTVSDVEGNSSLVIQNFSRGTVTGANSISAKTVLRAIDFMTVGNGDGKLDQNECITINDTLLIVGSTSPISGTIRADWGCNATNCTNGTNNNVASVTTLISSASVAPALTRTLSIVSVNQGDSAGQIYNRPVKFKEVVKNNSTLTAVGAYITPAVLGLKYIVTDSIWASYNGGALYHPTFTAGTGGVGGFDGTTGASSATYAFPGNGLPTNAIIQLGNLLPGDSIVVTFETNTAGPVTRHSEYSENTCWQWAQYYCGCLRNHDGPSIGGAMDARLSWQGCPSGTYNIGCQRFPTKIYNGRDALPVTEYDGSSGYAHYIARFRSMGFVDSTISDRCSYNDLDTVKVLLSAGAMDLPFYTNKSKFFIKIKTNGGVKWNGKLNTVFGRLTSWTANPWYADQVIDNTTLDSTILVYFKKSNLPAAALTVLNNDTYNSYGGGSFQLAIQFVNTCPGPPVKRVYMTRNYTIDTTSADPGIESGGFAFQTGFEWNSLCSVSPCNDGVTMLSYDESRTTFGAPDNNLDGLADASGSINLSVVKTKLMTWGDTMQLKYKMIVKTTQAGGVSYMYLKSTINYSDINAAITCNGFLKKDTARIVLKRPGVGSFTGVGSAVPLSTSNNYLVNLSLQGTGGITIPNVTTYQNGDTIELTENIIYWTPHSGWGPTTWSFLHVPYTSTVINPTLAQQYKCDSVICNFQTVDMYTQFGSSNINSGVACGDTMVMRAYALAQLNGTGCGSNFFPGEVRHIMAPAFYKIVIPAASRWTCTGIRAHLSTNIKNCLNPISNQLVPPSLYYYSGDTIMLDIKAIDQYFGVNVLVSNLYSIETFDFSLKYVPLSSEVGCVKDHSFPQSVFNTFTRFEVSRPMDTTTLIKQASNTTNGGYGGNTGSAFLNCPGANGNTVTLYAGNTVSVSNPAVVVPVRYFKQNIGASGFDFMAIPNTSGITVDSVKDVTTGAKLVTVAGSSIYQVGYLGVGVTRDFNVYTHVNLCQTDSLWIYADRTPCSGYPSSWASYSCQSNANKVSYKYITFQGELQMVDSLFSTNKDMCAADTLQFHVINSQTQDANTVKISFTLPQFMSLLPGQTQYKKANGAYVTVSDPILTAGVYSWTVPTTDTLYKITQSPNNSIYLRCGLITSCGYASGSQITSTISGNVGCGAITSLYNTNPSPLTIIGAPSLSYFTNPSISISQVDNCTSASFNYRVALRISGGSTGSGDSVRVIMPAEYGFYSYDASASGNHNAPSVQPVVINLANGRQQLSWLMPAAVAGGDSIVFVFTYNELSASNKCAVSTSRKSWVNTFINSGVYCATIGANCLVSIPNGADTANVQSLKPSLSTTASAIFTQACDNLGKQSYLNLSGIINNSGTAPIASGTNIILEPFIDKDNSGTINAGDLAFSPIVYAGGLAIGANYSYTYIDSILATTCTTCAGKNILLRFSNTPSLPLGSSQCLCDTVRVSSVTPTLVVNTKPNAGANQTVTCAVLLGGLATLSAIGTGSWAAQAGNPGTATIATPNSQITNITAFSAAGTYNFIWSDGSCTDTTSVTVTAKPEAGVDQTVTCISSFPGGTATMAGSGTGTWTAQAGNAGTATITTASSPNTTITNFSAIGLYKFIFTNGSCSDTAYVTVSDKVFAGADQTITCVALPGGSVTMAASGTGTWSAQAGNPGTATITTPSSQTTTITTFSAAGTYNFIWSQGACADTLSVFVTAKPDAGANQTVSCVALPGGIATMTGSGTGTWSAQSNNPGTATITTPSSPTTTITSFSLGGTYNFIYTNGFCTDTATIIVTVKPNAGTDKTVCTPSVPGGTATMSGIGLGTWSAKSGNPGTATINFPNSQSTSISNFSAFGTYYFILDNGICTDTATVTVNAKPNAGVDKTVTCLTSFPSGTATMAAIGTGTWTEQTGNPGTSIITASSTSNTTITDFSAAGTYKFIWNDGSCTDTASVIVTAKPNAGIDQTVTCVTLPAGTATMAATGTGTWTAQTGNPGTATITTASSPTTTITTFFAAGTYKFIWTNGTCTDTAYITVTAKPNAGIDKTVTCVVFPGGSSTMTATGTGTWTAQTGNPGTATITTASSPTTTITTFTVAGTYNFIWTNASACTDTVSITVTAKPNIGADQSITCLPTFPGGSATMTAIGTGTWAAQSGNAGTATITFINIPTTTITAYSASGTYNFIWNDGVCTDTMSIIVTAKPSAGADQPNICAGTSATLTGTIVNTGTWTAQTGNPIGATLGITTAGVATVNFANTTSGIFSFIYTATNGCADTMNITVPAKPSAPTATVTQPTCSVTTGTITVNSPSSGVTYSFDNGTTFQSSNIKSGLAAAITYQIVVKDDVSNCVSTPTPSVINAILTIPTAPTATVTQPTCGVTTGTITVNSPSSGVTYSFDNGTTYQASATSSALTAATTYQVKVKDNTSACISTATAAVMNAILAVPSAPVVTITQPTCSVTTGLIEVTAPSSGVTYSFDNGITYQASAISSALTADATYQVKVKDNTSNCVSVATPSVINAVLAVPSAPVVSITQPTCSVTTGLIEVTAPSSGVTYSFDSGTTYQASATSSALAAAATYQVKVQDNTSACISTATSAVINAVLAVPSAPVVTITQPTCSVTTGLIEVTAPSSGVTYSFDNGATYQASATSSALTAGTTYQVKVKDNASNCVSVATPSVINDTLSVPSAPTVSITQPTCNVTTGSITVNTPPSGVTYSFDNGTTYQASNIKSSLAASTTYQVIVKDDVSLCVSTATSTVITAQPATPVISSVAKTDASLSSCPSLNDGTITVTATGSNLQYSKDNETTWQASNSFAGLVAGSYSIKVKDNVSTCEVAYLANPVVVTAPICATCATSSVGGTATYTGGTICSTANIGTISLMGETGNVTKWQTSTNGGTAWTDIAGTLNKTSYNFINAANGQQFRAVVNVNIVTCTDAFSSVVTITTSATACTTTTCSYTSSSFSPTISTSTNPTYTTHVILVNPTTGVMSYVTAANSTAFTGVALGDYVMYTVSYDNTMSPTPTISVGTNITALAGCTSISDPLLTKVCCPTIVAPTVTITQPSCGVTTGSITVTNPTTGVTYSFDNGATFQTSNVKNGLLGGTYSVVIKNNVGGCVTLAKQIVVNNRPTTGCNCDNTTGNISFTISNQNTTAAYTQKYVLTTNNGLMIALSNTPSFTGLSSGQYAVYALNYETTSGVTGLTVGQNISLVSGACLNVAVPLFYHVCIPSYSCNSTTGDITATISSQNNTTTYTQKYALTDETGKILLLSNNPTFVGLTNGKYQMFAINYETASGVTGLTINSNILAVAGLCFNLSTPLYYQVCMPPSVYTCNNATGTIAATITNQNASGTYTQKYALTTDDNTILQVANAPTFAGLIDGQYKLCAINYETTSGLTGLTVGQNLSGLAGICFNKSTPLLYQVCLPVFNCNNNMGNITATITGQNTGATFTQKYVLTDSVEKILQIATTPTFTGLPNGRYKLYGVNYETASGVTNLTVGQTMSAVTGFCVKKSNALLYQICKMPEICNNRIDDDGDGLIDCEDVTDCPSCGCDNTTGNITFTNTGQTTTGYTQVYVLTDSTAKILKSSTTAAFNGLASGRYRVYAVNYETTSGITGLTVGQYINGVTGSCMNKSLPQLFKVCICVTFNFKAMLEGPYQTATQTMHTLLNDRGLLPGQTPIGQFAVQTPQGQPYKGLPWNYAGTEGDTITTYPATVVDWVLVSLRLDSTTNANAFRVTGWLHNDGHISFISPCFDLANGSYFVVIEHRNHVGVMSPNKVLVQSGTMVQDFTINDSYILTNPPSLGEKAKGGKWVMFAGDGKKDTYTTNFDINFNDSQFWRTQSGIFDQYRQSDFDMNADVNFLDNYLWKSNSGKYSGVPH